MSGCFVHYRMAFSIPGLYPLDASSNSFSCQMFPGVETAKLPPVENYWCVSLWFRILVLRAWQIWAPLPGLLLVHCWPGKLLIFCICEMLIVVWPPPTILGRDKVMHLAWWFTHSENSMKVIIVINSTCIIIPTPKQRFPDSNLHTNDQWHFQLCCFIKV